MHTLTQWFIVLPEAYRSGGSCFKRFIFLAWRFLPYSAAWDVCGTGLCVCVWCRVVVCWRCDVVWFKMVLWPTVLEASKSRKGRKLWPHVYLGDHSGSSQPANQGEMLTESKRSELFRFRVTFLLEGRTDTFSWPSHKTSVMPDTEMWLRGENVLWNKTLLIRVSLFGLGQGPVFNTAWQAGDCSSHAVIEVVATEIFHTLLFELNEKPDRFGVLLLLLGVTGLV